MKSNTEVPQEIKKIELSDDPVTLLLDVYLKVVKYES